MLPCNLFQWLSGAVIYIFAHQAKCLWLDSFASGRTQKNQSGFFFVFYQTNFQISFKYNVLLP